MGQNGHVSGEHERELDLMRLLPSAFDSALDVGARTGHFSRLLADRTSRVVALDLTAPAIDHPHIESIAGDIQHLPFSDASFDFVLCTEVLEHIPDVEKACRELARVTRQWLVIGVPYRQDTRVGRNTCLHCGHINPPWGHINTFDEQRLLGLMPTLASQKISFIGENRQFTNALATRLMDWSGNPWGTYEQDEACLRCGHKLQPPPRGGTLQRAVAAVALRLSRIESARRSPRPNWIHILFRR